MDWGEQILWREKVHQRYPDVWDMGIVKKRLPFILKHLKDVESVIEIGPHDRKLGDQISHHEELGGLF